MIQANELRIGNLIADHEAGGYFQIESIQRNIKGIYWVSYRLDSIQSLLNEIEPIPLTEEWLIKLGFKQWVEFGHKTGTFDLMPLCGVSYDIVTKKVMILEKGNPNSHWIERKIEYVHQLQNLYFALREKELEIN